MFKLRTFRFVAVTFGAAFLLFTTVFVPVRARLFHNNDALQLTPGDSIAEGTWTLDLDNYQENRRNGLMIEIRQNANSYRMHSISSDRAPRLDRDWTDGGKMNFSIVNDPGDLIFTGAVSKKTASGSYRFKPNPGYTAEATKLFKRDLSTDELLELAFSDVSLNYLRDVIDAGINADFQGVLALRHHGVKSEMAKEFAALGFKTSAEITRLRDHGVPPDLAREAKNLGYARSADEVVLLRDHGVTPDYLKGWKEADFALSTEEMVRLRNHGVKADYAAAWKSAGYKLSADELIRARNQGIPADFPAALTSTESRPTVDEAIRLRQHGVDAKYYRSIRELNATYTAEDIVRFRQHGVPADYVAAVNVAGRPAIDAQTIIDLRNRGVSAETARKLRQ